MQANATICLKEYCGPQAASKLAALVGNQADGLTRGNAMPDTVPRFEPHAELCGKVLCIEAVDAHYDLVESILSGHASVQLSRAATGAEGMHQVRNSNPDFVLLDMQLPDMSGLDVVRQLSDTIAERDLRITILTGDQPLVEVIKAMSLGAYEYLVKPVDARLLEAGVRRALTGKDADPSGTLNTRH